MAKYATVVAPEREPVDLVEARGNLRYDGIDGYDVLARAVRAARADAENRLHRALITRTMELYLDCFPTVIELPMPPLISVVSIKYYDTLGVLQTLPTTVYQVDPYATPGTVSLKSGQSWPSVEAGRVNAITVQYTCGYGATSNLVPEPIRQWILCRIGSFDVVRGGVVARETSSQGFDVMAFVDGLLVPYEVVAL